MYYKPQVDRKRLYYTDNVRKMAEAILDWVVRSELVSAQLERQNRSWELWSKSKRKGQKVLVFGVQIGSGREN